MIDNRYIDMVAYIALGLAVLLVIYTTVMGIRRDRRYKKTQQLANTVIKQAEDTNILAQTAYGLLKLVYDKIHVLETENALLRAQLLERNES